MIEATNIFLDKSAMQQNWGFLREYFGKDIKISAVVKGNAYGHGISSYVPLAEECGVNHFSVFNAGEAREVFEVSGKKSTIMIMGAMSDKDIVWAIENDIEFYVFDMVRFDRAIEEAEKCGKKAIIHIEAETGMYRTGFDVVEMPAVIERLEANKDRIVFKGLCMHFAGAELLSNYVRLKQQKIVFRKILRQFKNAGVEPEMVHTCCSAASVRFPEMRYDMLRIGIMQYGFWPSQELMVEYMVKQEEQGNGHTSPLKRVISWESKVMSIKTVPKGSYIGYGYTYFADRVTQVAVVPVGYAHGFSRGLSNSGRVLISEYRVPVIGIVNMNCIAVDITDVPNVQQGDKVTLIGMQGDKEISVASFGEMTSQLNYELLTRLPLNIRRDVING